MGKGLPNLISSLILIFILGIALVVILVSRQKTEEIIKSLPQSLPPTTAREWLPESASQTPPAEEEPVVEEPTIEEPVVEEPAAEESPLDKFAQCLTEKEMKFYGAYWCSWCNKQKELFGESVQYLPYIECVDKETNQLTTECQEAGIEIFPTWQLPNGEKPPGFRALEELSVLSGCPLE